MTALDNAARASFSVRAVSYAVRGMLRVSSDICWILKLGDGLGGWVVKCEINWLARYVSPEDG